VLGYSIGRIVEGARKDDSVWKSKGNVVLARKIRLQLLNDLVQSSAMYPSPY
jgi:hypothetical protein